jgi:hypothetical protein
MPFKNLEEALKNNNLEGVPDDNGKTFLDHVIATDLKRQEYGKRHSGTQYYREAINSMLKEYKYEITAPDKRAGFVGWSYSSIPVTPF